MSLRVIICTLAIACALGADQKVPLSLAPLPSPYEAAAGCPVAPLPPITDPAAQVFEKRDGPDGALDTTDLNHGMASALVRFERLVARVGGSLDLKSAYRPPSYQEHLQQVWYKWMELKNNQDPACQPLRASVEQEFTRHHLIESQHPVTSSDHTRGLAFDATVLLPKRPMLGRRRMTLDSLARLVGLRRPDILHDPVHFKFVGTLMASAVRHVSTARASVARRYSAARRTYASRRLSAGRRLSASRRVPRARRRQYRG